MANMNPKKMPMPEQEPDVRNKNFDEVTLGYTAEKAIEEAQSCLNCKKNPSMPRCPQFAAVSVRRKASASATVSAASRANRLPSAVWSVLLPTMRVKIARKRR